MKCSACKAPNLGDARFCAQCGAPLVARCPACNEVVAAGQNFCAACGASLPQEAGTTSLARARPPARMLQSILNSPRMRSGERKQVTVLFADMKGSMELLAGRDPEEARSILDPVLQLMIEAVHRYEGTVNQVMGDGIMALFGAPLAHEDHAVRACYAALEMQDAVRRYAQDARARHQVEVHVRVGINSGEVVVRAITNDFQLDYTAVGQSTHLAGRMEQLAEPGTILITAETRKLAEGHIEFSSLGPVAVRGLEEPVEVFRLAGMRAARTRLQALSAQHLTRIVGRENEIEQLQRALGAAADGHGQVVAVVGAPGTGKSRLIYEVAVSQGMREWLVLEACALPYNSATGYQPFIDILKSYFRIEQSDDSQRVAEKVRTAVLGLDAALQPAVAPLLDLLGVVVDAPDWTALGAMGRRRRTREAVKSLLLRESRRQPVCLIVEDLHWADTETQAVLDELVQGLADARLLLLISYRPEFRHGWADQARYSRLRIDDLAPRAAEELLRYLLGPGKALSSLGSRLIEQTGGNPFFLEECVLAAVESGVLAGQPGAYSMARPMQATRVPATVHAVLAARIDRLAPEDKVLLGTAAVIGRNVALGLLVAIAGGAGESPHGSLARLRSAELLHESRQFPDIEYTFRHALIHEVAYGSLLHDQRRDLHARIVAELENLAGDRLADYLERLAHHAREGELWEKAARYLRLAGNKAFARSANRDAVVWFEQALAALKRLPQAGDNLVQAIDLNLGLRNSLTLLGEHERALVHLREAQTLAERIGDRLRFGRALSFQVNGLALLGQHDAAIEVGHRARRVSAELEDLPLRIATDQYVGRAHLYLGDFSGAIGLFEGIVKALRGALEREHLGIPALPSVFARSHLIEALAELGRFAESERYCDEARAIAATTKHTDTLWWAHHARGLHHLMKREIEPAIAAHEQAYELANVHDMPVYRARSGAELALAWSLGGRTAEALALAAGAMAEMASRSRTTTHSIISLLVGRVSLIAGEYGQAAEHVGRALGDFRQRRERAHEATALYVLGDIAAGRPQPDLAAAEAHYRSAGSLADELGMRPLAARNGLKIGLLLRARGQSDEAAQALRAARDGFRDMKLASELSQSEAGLSAAA